MTAQITDLSLDELKNVADLDLGTSSYLRVGQERIDGFADVTEDHQWIHVDAARASETPLGTTIAHGYLSLSLVPKLLFELVHIPDAAMVVNYGLDKLRFLAPVPSGEEICLKARLVSATERPGGVLFRVRGSLHLRAEDRRVLVAEMLFLAQAAAPS